METLAKRCLYNGNPGRKSRTNKDEHKKTYMSSGQYFQYLEQMLLWLSKALILSMTCEAGNSITLAMTTSRLIQVSRKGQKQGTSKGTHTLAVLFFYLCSNFLNCLKSIKSHA